MKELSIEEKAKRYDEALKRARKIENGEPINVPDGTSIPAAIFPELYESEGERIRKQIISFLKEFEHDHYRSLDFSSWISWLEKQGEQKPVDKVESIFEVGNWIVNNQSKYTFLIKRGGSRFQAENTDGDIYSFYLLPNGEEEYHLWTIEDAKDGDVLVSESNQPFIYNGKYTDSVVGAYVGISFNGEIFSITESSNWTLNKDVKPATKEQRNLLFLRIKENGYEWDADKKELKKL